MTDPLAALDHDLDRERRRGSGGGRGHGGSSSRSPKRRHRRWRHRHKRAIRVVVGVLALVVLLVLGYLIHLNSLLAGVRRAPLLAEYDGPAGQGTNVLLIESDQSSGRLRPDERSLVVQLVHLSEASDRAAVVHFPRNLVLPVPGHGRERVDTVFAQGGSPLLIETLQRVLRLRVDHVAQVALPGYEAVTDRLGGVGIRTSIALKSGKARVTERHLDGAQALAWAEHRKGLRFGDIETGKRHQEWQRAMLAATVRPAVLLNPLTVEGLVRDLTHNLVVDEAFTTGEMRSLLWGARGLRPSTITYLTAPVRPDETTRPSSRPIHPAADRMAGLGLALASDNAAAIAGYDN